MENFIEVVNFETNTLRFGLRVERGTSSSNSEEPM